MRNVTEIWLLFHDAGECFGEILSLEQPLSREQLMKHHTECPNVRARIDALAASLFRRHVGCCSENDASLCGGHRKRRGILRSLRSFSYAILLGESEIQDFNCAVVFDF